MSPKREKIDKRLTVPLNNVKHGITFEYCLKFWRHHGEVPKYGCGPKSHLKDNADDLTDIPNERIEGGHNPAQPKGKNTHTKEIIKKLEVIKTERHVLEYDQSDKNNQEYRVCNQARNHLYYRQEIGRAHV